jgi:hypothetical protein
MILRNAKTLAIIATTDGVIVKYVAPMMRMVGKTLMMLGMLR